MSVGSPVVLVVGFEQTVETIQRTGNDSVSHADHERCYIDRATGQRILTFQPYFGNGFREALKGTLEDYLALIKPECEKFADRYGLEVQFSAKGFHFPKKVVLIEYRQKFAA